MGKNYLLAHLLGGIRREDALAECIWPRGTIMMSQSWHWMASGWTIHLCRRHFDVMRTVAKRPIELLKQWTACIWAFYSRFLFYDFPSKIKVQDTYFIIFKRVDWDLGSKNFWVVWENEQRRERVKSIFLYLFQTVHSVTSWRFMRFFFACNCAELVSELMAWPLQSVDQEDKHFGIKEKLPTG